MSADEAAPGKIAELLAKGLGLLGDGRDALQGSVVGKTAGSALVSKGLGAAEILAHLGVFAGWVDNKTATSLQMAEAAVDYLGGKIDGKTAVGSLMSAYTDRLVFDKLKDSGMGDFGAKAISYAVSGFVGMIVGRLSGAIQEGVIGKDTSLGKALDALTKQKNQRDAAQAAGATVSAPPTPGMTPGGAGRAAAQGAG